MDIALIKEISEDLQQCGMPEEYMELSYQKKSLKFRE